MDLPSEWCSSNESSNPNKKRSAVDKATSRSVKQRCHEPTKNTLVVIDNLVEDGAAAGHQKRPLRDEILRNLGRDTDTHAQEILEVDSLICRLPYKKMLAALCGDSIHSKAAQLQYVARAYEESFMHEPMGKDQKPCAKGSSCECMFIDKENPFTCMEFLLPGEQSTATASMCVLCCRATTQQLYYDIIFDKHDISAVIQRYGNLHSQVRAHLCTVS